MPTTIIDADDVAGRGKWWIWATSNTAGDFTSGPADGLKLTSINPNAANGTGKRRNHLNFERVRVGDLLFGYVTAPEQAIVAIFEVTKELNHAARFKPIEFRRVEGFSAPLKLAELEAIPAFAGCEWPDYRQGPLLAMKGNPIPAIRAILHRRQSSAPAIAANNGLPSQEIVRPVEGSSPDALADFEKHWQELDLLSPTEREEVKKSRIGQGKFRRDLLDRWKTCAVTGCSYQRILRASHIQPWRDSDNRERLDEFNGLLLAPHLDALFDAGAISFDDSGQIMLSAELSSDDRAVLNVKETLRLRTVDDRHKPYLSAHRKKYGFEQ